ncbi:MAG: TIGR01777 family protein [Rhodothermales bacterium]|nr:TIGR01777 family protein [Rhodothermales bacterium]
MAQHFSYSSELEQPPAEVFAWHERPGALARLTPPWVPMRLESFEGIRDGDKARIRLGWGPLSVLWVAGHRDYTPGQSFTDDQLDGPFASWTHTHRFEETERGGCRLTDSIDFKLPAGSVGALAAGHVRTSLEAQFAYRHAITKNDLHLHSRYRTRPLKIAVTGASGLIGSALVAFLQTGGHTVLRLVRSRPVSDDEIYWNVRDNVVDAPRLEGLDAVVHLAGENLMAPRWTDAKKQRIYDSRINGTRLLATTVASLQRPPSVFVSSSAIGIYGDRGDETIDETSSLDRHSYLAKVCADWESACDAARSAGIRTANVRTGIVVSGGGGALAPMLPLFKLGLGGRFGDPRTFLSWIALDDVVGGLYHIICSDSVSGPVNMTGPDPLNWDDFATTIGKVVRRPTFVTVPTWLTGLATGEMGKDVILSGAKVLPRVLKRSGYDFLYPTAESALRHQLGYPWSASKER